MVQVSLETELLRLRPRWAAGCGAGGSWALSAQLSIGCAPGPVQGPRAAPLCALHCSCWPDACVEAASASTGLVLSSLWAWACAGALGEGWVRVCWWVRSGNAWRPASPQQVQTAVRSQPALAARTVWALGSSSLREWLLHKRSLSACLPRADSEGQASPEMRGGALEMRSLRWVRLGLSWGQR